MTNKLKIKTIRDLLRLVDCTKERPSIAYNNSRTVLKYLDKPMVGYGIGFAGFVCIFKDKMGFGHAVAFGNRRPLTNYNDSSFGVCDVDKAVEQIKNNPLFAYRNLDEKQLSGLKIKTKTERPLVGKLVVETKTYQKWDNKWGNYKRSYSFYRLKNGSFRIYQIYGKYGKYGYERKRYMDRETFVKFNLLSEDKSNVKITILENTLPDDINEWIGVRMI